MIFLTSVGMHIRDDARRPEVIVWMPILMSVFTGVCEFPLMVC